MESNDKPTEGIRLGIQPTCWTNDDFPELGDSTPYQQILDETASSGFAGGSTGHNYPSHVPSLKYALKRRGLGITSTWVGTGFTTEGQYNATLDLVRGQIEFLKSVETHDIVVAELASAVNQMRTKAVLADRPIFNPAQWFLLLRGLNEAGRIAAEAGMRLCYHPHVGTGVQVREEIDTLMEGTDPSVVSMCLDTGHALFSGVDPVHLARDYIDRIGHVHLKSVRKPVMDRAVAGKFSFYEAVLQGIFTVPGDPDGSIDFDPIFESFKKHGYRGWIVVEAEQDPGVANPLAYARMAREFIRKGLGV
ncbi:MAG TPA: myo-inosose-2 dehydratase [Tepidisphaeraceae bacterium]|nr:myo-inosose-2 dehydratase [Tepidisphaeraceae bacterium]